MRELRVEIHVRPFGKTVVRASKNDVPNQGLLGPLVLAVCSANLPPGRYVISSGPVADPRLATIVHELNALRPSLA